jgi:hypothetical protein
LRPAFAILPANDPLPFLTTALPAASIPQKLMSYRLDDNSEDCIMDGYLPDEFKL